MSVKLPDYLTKTEVERILAIAVYDNFRNYLMIKLMWMCGLRVSEVCAIMLENIDFDERKIKIVQSKRNKDRYVPITEDLLNELKTYVEKNSIDGDNIFLSTHKKPITSRRIQQIISKYSNIAGIKKSVTPHTFRHSFAVHFLKQTKNLRALQKILGHSNIRITEVYLQLTFDDIQTEYDQIW